MRIEFAATGLWRQVWRRVWRQVWRQVFGIFSKNVSRETFREQTPIIRKRLQRQAFGDGFLATGLATSLAAGFWHFSKNVSRETFREQVTDHENEFMATGLKPARFNSRKAIPD